MRQLATIRRIKDIQPIEGADKIELCQVDGWQVVAQKGLHRKDLLVIYCEIDSFLPIRPEFEFMRKSSYKKMADGTEGFRLKTIKLRGKLSQGLILPLDVLYPVAEKLNINKEGEEPHYIYFINGIQMNGPDDDWNEYLEGMNVTDILGIKKYEQPIPAQLSGKVRGMFPTFIKKTDQERIQNLIEYFDKYKDIEFEVTEKLDGSSCTYYMKDGQFGVCSRNLDLLEGNGTMWKLAKELHIREYLATKGDYAIQGEVVGEGIQGNPYKLIGQKFFVFDIWDIEHQRHFTSAERLNFIGPTFMKSVPVLENADSMPLRMTLDQLLQVAEGESALNSLTIREGLVFKALKRVEGQVLSFKVINNKYLLSDTK